MTRTAGWYPAENDNRINRYWDGTAWTSEKVWDGTAWVDHIAPAPVTTVPATAPAAGAQAAAAVAPIVDKIKASIDNGDIQLPRDATAWSLVAGAGAVALSAFTPWLASNGGSGTNPAGAGPLVLLGFAGAVLGIVGWRSTAGRLSKGRRIGLTVIAALATVLLFAGFSHVAELNRQYKEIGTSVSPGTGMYLFMLGLVGLWTGTIRSWISRKAHNEV